MGSRSNGEKEGNEESRQEEGSQEKGNEESRQEEGSQEKGNEESRQEEGSQEKGNEESRQEKGSQEDHKQQEEAASKDGLDLRDNDIEADRQEITEELDVRTANATKLARQLALGVVGLVWGMLALGDGSGILSASWQHNTLVFSGLLAILTLFCDWAQAFLGFVTVDGDYKRVHDENYDPERGDDLYQINWTYKGTVWCFWIKQVLAPLSVAFFLCAVVPGLIRPGQPSNQMPTPPPTSMTKP